MISAVLSIVTAAADARSAAISPRLDAAMIYRKTKDSVVAIEVTTRAGMAYGTGFFFRDGWTIATCNHVVEGATKIVVRGTRGGRWIPTSISTDRAGDTVLLHLSGATGRTPLMTARAAEIGEPVFVIGNPLGILTGSLSTGIVSANRKIDTVPIVQTTAPISEGSSGSPVLDDRGRVLGMVSFTFSEGQNLNMAIGAEVLKWVAGDRRNVALPGLFAANAAAGSAPMRLARAAAGSGAREVATAREAFVSLVAQYDGRVVDGFVRWQLATLAWQRREGGVTEPDVRRAFTAFRDAVSSEGIDRAMTAMAEAADEQEYLAQLQSAAQSVLHVAEDKLRQDAELAHLDSNREAAKRDAAQYGRMVEALCDFGAASEDPSWMDVGKLYGSFPTPAKGECVMLHQDAFVDADLPHSTVIRDAMPGSSFRQGDKVLGARVVTATKWTPIDTWEDLWQFTTDHGPHLCQRGWELQVARDGQMIAIPMCPAGRRSLH